jgi:hypothetical protein
MVQQSNTATTADGTLDMGDVPGESDSPDERELSGEREAADEPQPTDAAQANTRWQTTTSLLVLIGMLGTLLSLNQLHQAHRLTWPAAVQPILNPVFRELYPILKPAAAITVVLCGLYLLNWGVNRTDIDTTDEP